MTDTIISLIKLLCINFITCYAYFRILGNQKITLKKKLIILLIIILVSFINLLFSNHFSIMTNLLLTYFTFGIILSKISKNKLGISFIVTTMSISISYAFVYISIIIIFALTSIVSPSSIKPIYTILVACTFSINAFALISIFFKFKRFKNGFSFIKNRINNEHFEAHILIINSLIIFVFLLLENFHSLSFKDLATGLLIFVIMLFIVLQKNIILYQKQKLQVKTLKDYEQELAETKEKLATALEEKEKLVKSNHEFYHRQEALNKKLTDLLAQQKLLTNTEFGEDIGNLADRINNLSNEYIEKTKMLPKLTKTNIVEIDDMFSYLQSECDKNNIEFILKIECDVNYIIDNYISKSQLETLLGDLIRNAIIAVNHSQNKFRSIMTVLGIKDDNYEICVLDSGIDFEINTLINLGLARASTHLDEGGTGIGFITTFETINSCNASLIINEVTNNNYSKALQIKFDSKNEYVIISKRIEEIKQLNKLNRNIILKG